MIHQFMSAVNLNDFNTAMNLLKHQSVRDYLHSAHIGNYVLYQACVDGQLEVVKNLLEIKSVRDNAHSAALSNYALISACRNGHFRVVKCFLEIMPLWHNTYGFMTDETYEIFIKKMYEHPKGIRFLAENFVQILSIADSENKRNFAANLHVQLIRDIDRLEDDISICLDDYHCLFKEDNLWALNRLFQEHGLELMYEYNFGGIEDVRTAIQMGCPLILEYFLTLPGSGERHRRAFTNTSNTMDSRNEYFSMLEMTLKAYPLYSRMHSVLVCLAVYIPEFKARISDVPDFYTKFNITLSQFLVQPDYYANLTKSLSLVELGYCLARKGLSKDIASNIGQYVNINAPSSYILHGYHKASLDKAELRRQIILEQENCKTIGLFEQFRNTISNLLFHQAEEIFDDEEDMELDEEQQSFKKRRRK